MSRKRLINNDCYYETFNDCVKIFPEEHYIGSTTNLICGLSTLFYWHSDFNNHYCQLGFIKIQKSFHGYEVMEKQEYTLPISFLKEVRVFHIHPHSEEIKKLLEKIFSILIKGKHIFDKTNHKKKCYPQFDLSENGRIYCNNCSQIMNLTLSLNTLLSKFYELLSNQFTNYLQWLPKELFEILIEILEV